MLIWTELINLGVYANVYSSRHGYQPDCKDFRIEVEINPTLSRRYQNDVDSWVFAILIAIMPYGHIHIDLGLLVDAGGHIRQ